MKSCPNGALTFRPSPAVLAVLGEREPQIAHADKDKQEADGQTREVWELDGKRFTPIAVRVGLADVDGRSCESARSTPAMSRSRAPCS